MTITHIITDSVVINTIVATVEEARAVYPEALLVDGEEYPGGVGCVWDGVTLSPPEPTPAPEPSQFEKDQSRYAKRAAVKDELMAYMAADNMSRVRSGAWSVADLAALLDDPAVVAANALMGTLSFELVAQQIQAATTPLLTPEIKADWTSRLEAHYYLEG